MKKYTILLTQENSTNMEFKKLPSGLYAVIVNGYIEILTPEEFEKLDQFKKKLKINEEAIGFNIWWSIVKRKYFEK